MSAEPFSWGLMPDNVISLLKRREWENFSNLKALLLSQRKLPITIGLKPPTGAQITQNVEHFRLFILAWNEFKMPDNVVWKSQDFRKLGIQKIPVSLKVNSIQQLADILGSLSQLKIWEQNIEAFLTIMQRIGKSGSETTFQYYSLLVNQLKKIEKFTDNEIQLFEQLFPQIKAKMGKGLYLRALPLTGVDTKFLENHLNFIESTLDVIFSGKIEEEGGLLNWLDCKQNPSGWLMVRPLCDRTKAALGNLSILQLSTGTLLEQELPCFNVLVVENKQSGLALPKLDNTIAVFGGGKNISWMSAEWLAKKNVGYWGDIDTWGLSILGGARAFLPNINPIMMDQETVLLFENRMVSEPEPILTPSLNLTESEENLFKNLLDGRYQSSRLEQERISADYINIQLNKWLYPAL